MRGQLNGPDGKPLRGRVRFLANRTARPITGGLTLPAPVEVDLDARGEFVANLTPSAEVGRYTLRTPAGTFIVDVPAQPAAKLADIVVWRGGAA